MSQSHLDGLQTFLWQECRRQLLGLVVGSFATGNKGGSHGGEEVDCCLFVCRFGCRHLHICHFCFPSTSLLSLPSLSPLSASLHVLCLLSQLIAVYVHVVFWLCGHQRMQLRSLMPPPQSGHAAGCIEERESESVSLIQATRTRHDQKSTTRRHSSSKNNDIADHDCCHPQQRTDCHINTARQLQSILQPSPITTFNRSGRHRGFGMIESFGRAAEPEQRVGCPCLFVLFAPPRGLQR